MTELSRDQVERAQRAMRAGHTRQAVYLLQQVLSSEPDHAVAHALLSLCLHDQKRLEAALHEARLSLTLDSESPFAHLAMGILCTSRREPRKAEEHLTLARTLDPENPQIALAMARLHQVRGRASDELLELEKALALAPDDPDTMAALAEGYFERGRLAEAEAMIETALAEEPEHADSLVVRGRLLLQRGDVEAARDQALWVLQSDANHRGGLILLTAIKAKQSVWLGLWWRYHSFLTALGEARSMLVLLAAFAVYRVGLVAFASAQSVIIPIWLLICAYTWIGPALFAHALNKELEEVSLKDSF